MKSFLCRRRGLYLKDKSRCFALRLFGLYLQHDLRLLSLTMSYPVPFFSCLPLLLTLWGQFNPGLISASGKTDPRKEKGPSQVHA